MYIILQINRNYFVWTKTRKVVTAYVLGLVPMCAVVLIIHWGVRTHLAFLMLMHENDANARGQVMYEPKTSALHN